MPVAKRPGAYVAIAPSGGSTLITSAPKSPRIIVAYGPITT